jgi:YbbR domain-containing protein
VALCVFAAAVFWLFNAFNKKYATNVRFPLVFEYNHERYVPVESLPHQINLNVSGNGWDLFRKHLGLKLPELSISLDRPLETRKLVGSTLSPVLASQLGNLQINYVVTDTLKVQMDEKDVHQYKVVADLSGITFREGYGRISPIVILPDSIKVTGPKSVLHSLADTLLVAVSRDRLSEDFREEAEVTLPGYATTKLQPSIVQVMFEVGEITKLEKKIPVSVVRNKKIKLLGATDSVKVLFQIPVKSVRDFNLLSKEIEAEANVKKLKRGDYSVVPKLSHLPGYAILLHTDSVKVKLN